MPKWLKVVDRQSGKVIAGGQIINEKRTKKGIPLYLFSFDGKYYFSNKSDRYDVVPNEEHQYYALATLPKEYIVLMWNNYVPYMAYDVIREFGLEEVDVEIEQLIRALNDMGGIKTTSSCCGHGHSPPYVTFNIGGIKGWASLSYLLHIISVTPYLGNLYLSTVDAYNELGNITMSIRATCVGEIAYALLDTLAEKIDTIVNSSDYAKFCADYKKMMMEEIYRG